MLLAILCAVAAVAQETPKVQVFGGYAFTSVDMKGATDRQSFNGWDADFAARVAKNVSLVTDISGAYKSETMSISGSDVTAKARIYNYLFGPRVSASTGKITPFAEALFGVAHATIGADVTGVSGSISSNGFGMALGGGVDVNASKNFSIRLAKFDYMMNRVSFSAAGQSASENLNNFRIATGVVVKF